MEKFFLNRDFFINLLKHDLYRKVLDDIYIHIDSHCEKYVSYMKYDYYRCTFDVMSSDHCTSVFSASISVCNRKIQLSVPKYLIDTPEMMSKVQFFPLSPAWLLPCTNYKQFLNRCAMSLRVYRNSDFI